jgi:glucosamine--fructose-6-phosphate aminotransferase (isomerizing)
MCGIIGILQGNENIIPLLIKCLKQLKNRGYDSAGIGFVEGNKLNITKKAASVNEDVFEFLKDINFTSNCGIGHTRWATHGPKIDKNSHPHKSFDGICMVVHNGIIENYIDIKKKLKDHKFNSDTDSEVVSNLISHYYKIYNDKEKAINYSLKELRGTWGLVIMFADAPNTLYCCRHGSPLLISQCANIFITSSEQSGFCNLTQDYIALQNGDLCIATLENEKLVVSYSFGYIPKKITTFAEEYLPDKYTHWTLKEIEEQVHSCSSAINFGARIKDNIVSLGGLYNRQSELQKVTNIVLLGCGTSYNAALASRTFFKKFAKFHTVQVFDGAEFDKEDIPQTGKTLLILVSQSGETRDLHRCLSHKEDCETLGIINVVDSLIAREVDCGVYTNCGREIAVASTKSFTSQLLVLSLVAMWFGHYHRKIIFEKPLEDCRILPLQINKTLKACKESITKKCNKKNIFILGKYDLESISKEGALKIKEMSYIHAEGYSASSLKHGTFALLDESVVVILLITKNTYSEMLNVYQQVKSRNCSIFIISEKDCDIESDVSVPQNNTYYQLLISIVLQYIGYVLAIENNINPDFPRNLAKVVTVD